MKKGIKKTIAMILSLAMVITMSSGYHGKKVSAAVKTQCTTYEGKNIKAQDYTGKQKSYYQDTMKSYLTLQQDGSYMFVISQNVHDMISLVSKY